MFASKLLKVDFHCHSSASNDSLTSSEELVRAGRRQGLDRLVVTDHNSIEGALDSYKIDPELVIIGEEVMTTRGEILASYVTEKISPGLTPRETIKRLRDQGAFISVSHPFDSWRKGAWKFEDLLEIASLVDAVEIFNARCMIPGGNHRAKEFARFYNLPGTAGSDAHVAFELGAASLVLPQFTGPDELRKVIIDGKVLGKITPFWVHFFSRFSYYRKKVV